MACDSMRDVMVLDALMSRHDYSYGSPYAVPVSTVPAAAHSGGDPVGLMILVLFLGTFIVAYYYGHRTSLSPSVRPEQRLSAALGNSSGAAAPAPPKNAVMN